MHHFLWWKHTHTQTQLTKHVHINNTNEDTLNFEYAIFVYQSMMWLKWIHPHVFFGKLCTKQTKYGTCDVHPTQQDMTQRADYTDGPVECSPTTSIRRYMVRRFTDITTHNTSPPPAIVDPSTSPRPTTTTAARPPPSWSMLDQCWTNADQCWTDQTLRRGRRWWAQSCWQHLLLHSRLGAQL